MRSARNTVFAFITVLVAEARSTVRIIAFESGTRASEKSALDPPVGQCFSCLLRIRYGFSVTEGGIARVGGAAVVRKLRKMSLRKVDGVVGKSVFDE